MIRYGLWSQRLLPVTHSKMERRRLRCCSGGGTEMAGPLSPLQFQMAGSDSRMPSRVHAALGRSAAEPPMWNLLEATCAMLFHDYGSNPLVAAAVADRTICPTCGPNL